MRRNVYRFAIATVLALSMFVYLASGQQARLVSEIRTGQWTPMGSMADARVGACAAALLDGRVLIAGGIGASGVLNSAELYNVNAGFSSAAPMSTGRNTPTCVTLQDGRVLAAGGTDAIGALGTAEIYDPVANGWSPASDMVYARSGHTATRLKDGRVLIAGGEGQGAVRSTLETFDPAANSFTFVASATLSSARKQHGTALLADGRVLIVGGSDGTNALASSEFFDAATGTMTAGPQLSTPRAGLSATALLDGNVLIAGGNDGTKDLASAEIFDASTGSFVATGQMTTARSGQLAFLLPNNNQVLLIGGDQQNGSTELFTPWTNTFTATGNLQESRKSAAGANLGADGVLMLSGGSSNSRILGNSKLYRFATVKGEQEDHALKITGSGWQAGERVTLVTQQQSKTSADVTRMVAADSAGNIADTQPIDAQTAGKFSVTATSPTAAAKTGGSTGANLDQCADGANLTLAGQGLAACDWVNGNVNGSKATYFEGDSLPYRLVMTNVTAGPHTVTIEWDTTQSGKHALDYITSFNRTIPLANPCAGVTSAPCTSDIRATFPIPADLNLLGAGPSSANVPQVPGNFTMWGGSMSGVGPANCSATPQSPNCYTISGSYSSSSSTRITISFNSTDPTVVLAWSGHIATRLDWGAANSAIAISGSPFHTRLIDLDGGGGNQDRALSSDAAIFPATIVIAKVSATTGASATFGFSGTGSGFPGSGFPTGTVPVTTGSSQSIGSLTDFTNNAYTVTENDPTALGWAFNSASCAVTTVGLGGSSGTVSGKTATITLHEGDTLTCTYTNHQLNSALTVIKHVDANGTGSTKTASNFTMTVTGGNPSQGSFAGSESPGTQVTITPNTGYSVTESSPTGFTSSSSAGCSSSSGLAPGGSATCTITNTAVAPKITVKKSLTVAGDTGKFNLQIDGTTPASAANVGNGGTTGAQTVTVGSHTIAETQGTSTTLTNYTTGLACVTTGTTTAFTVTTSTPFQSGSVTLAEGDDVTCTFTNTKQGKLTVTKSLPVAGDTGKFNLQIDGTTPASAANVGNGGTTGAQTVTVGSHTIAETQGTSTTLTNYTTGLACVTTGTTTAFNVTTSTPFQSGSVTLAAGDDVTCTFTNNRKPTLTVVKICAPTTDITSQFTVNIGSTALPNAASPSVTCNNMTGVKTVLTPDSYTLTEPGPLPSGFTLPTSGTGAIGVTGWSAPGAFGGDCSATGGVSLANGQNKTCYILNVSSVCTPALPAPSSVPSILPQGRQPASRPTRVQRPASTN